MCWCGVHTRHGRCIRLRECHVDEEANGHDKNQRADKRLELAGPARVQQQKRERVRPSDCCMRTWTRGDPIVMPNRCTLALGHRCLHKLQHTLKHTHCNKNPNTHSVRQPITGWLGTGCWWRSRIREPAQTPNSKRILLVLEALSGEN